MTGKRAAKWASGGFIPARPILRDEPGRIAACYPTFHAPRPSEEAIKPGFLPSLAVGGMTRTGGGYIVTVNWGFFASPAKIGRVC
jgi:hypothetical protein